MDGGGIDSPPSELSDDSPSAENSSMEEGEKTAEEEEKKTDVEEKVEGKGDEQEVVLIQDTGFVVQLIIPAGEDFDLPVSWLFRSSDPKCRDDL